MDSRKRTLRILGLLLFAIGILLGMALAGVMAWADLEAQFYGFENLTQKRLGSLRCPPILTTAETGEIAATVANPVEKTLQLMVHAAVSGPGPLREEKALVSLAPLEKRQLTWTVTSDDVDLGFFIFAKVYTYPAYQSPMREAACGILMLRLPLLSGTQVLLLTLAISLLCIVAGLWLWRADKPLVKYADALTTAMLFLSGTVLLAIVVSSQGWWLPGLLLLVLSLLTISVTLLFLVSD